MAKPIRLPWRATVVLTSVPALRTTIQRSVGSVSARGGRIFVEGPPDGAAAPTTGASVAPSGRGPGWTVGSGDGSTDGSADGSGWGSGIGAGSLLGCGSTDGVGSTIGAGPAEASGSAPAAPPTLDRSRTEAARAVRLRRITCLRRGSVHQSTHRTPSDPDGATTAVASSADAGRRQDPVVPSLDGPHVPTTPDPSPPLRTDQPALVMRLRVERGRSARGGAGGPDLPFRFGDAGDDAVAQPVQCQLET